MLVSLQYATLPVFLAQPLFTCIHHNIRVPFISGHQTGPAVLKLFGLKSHLHLKIIATANNFVFVSYIYQYLYW